MCAKKKNSKRKALVVALIVSALLFIFIFLVVGVFYSKVNDQASETVSDVQGQQSSDMQETIQVEEIEKMNIMLDKGLTVVETGKYIGAYVEDGTNEVVSDVLMLVVRNDGKDDIQYAEITVETSAGDAHFSLSTLPVGESAVLLEQSRMPWVAKERYSNVTAKDVMVFSEPLSLAEDQLEIQVLNGVINIINISGTDIIGDISIYYKNYSVDMLYGGITYRVRLEGGLKADEIRQITASHFSASGSRIMFIDIE